MTTPMMTTLMIASSIRIPLAQALTVLGLTGLFGSTAWAQNAASGLPGGASKLRETYDDWAVACAVEKTGKVCTLSQQQVDSKTNQHALAIELQPSTTGLQGVLVLPFGLALEQGAALQIDDGPAGQRLHFRTCLPGGCLVMLTFDDKLTSALRKGGALNIKTVADGGDAASFRVSLKGLPNALARVNTLLK
jgi:invasion protein IalB